VKFERIRLQNVRPYADADLRLDRGVTVVFGPNGSGKSSLLEACFFALYGSKALDDATLDDVVTKGEEEAEVELWFSHDGGDYRVKRRLRATGDSARTAECVMETPDGKIDGATDVRERVEEMLRMDADAFVNCAYVRQGEVNKLIHASPGDRQDMIDDLLQLGKLEQYRERANEARLGVEDVLGGQADVIENLDEQIERKEDRDLTATLNELESERNDVVEEIERIEDGCESARETRETATEVLEQYEKRREELAELEAAIDDLQSTVAETERDRDELKERIQSVREELTERRERRDERLAGADVADPGEVPEVLSELGDRDEELRDRIEELNLERQDHVGEAETLRERAEQLETEAGDAREEATELAAEIEDEEATLEERRERLSELEDRVDDVDRRFEDAPVDREDADSHLADLEDERETLTESINERKSDRRTRRERIEEAERLLAEGKCPECGQPVEDSPHVDRLEGDRERVEELEERLEELRADRSALEDRIERAESLVEAKRERERLLEKRRNVSQLVEEKAEAIAADRERVDSLRERADELDEEAETKREAADEAAATADELQDDIAEVNAERMDLRDRIDDLEEIAELVEEIDDLEDEVESLRDRRESKAELNEERRQRLSEKRDRRNELREEVDEDRVEEARSEKQRAEEYLDQAEDELVELRSQRDDLKERIGAVRAELDQLDDLRQRREAVERRRESLASLRDETESLQDTYADLRSELRQRNVETLERMLNETFELVYANDSYARIELDGNYELTVYQKDGEPLDPEQLSGGERALFNLSLRTAIYRLLAEGIEGTAPLPPLILDEPTVFLDSGHVSRLLDLVEEMRELGVEQIVVVTHDEELVGAADAIVRVTKDPTTNRSSVERSDPVPTP
jgi:exonuclease SbcC